MFKHGTVLIGAAASLAMFATAVSADHQDGPAVTAKPSADIADLYSWTPATGRLVLIQTIHGDVAESIQYVFHIGRSSAPALATQPESWTEVICTFEGVTASCWAGAAGYVTGDASQPSGIGDASFRVHAGPHADPLFFYRAGFTQVADTVRAAAPALTFNAGGCPVIDAATSAVLVSILSGSGGGPAIDNYLGTNVSAIVVELDTALIAGSGEYFAVWASTHEAN